MKTVFLSLVKILQDQEVGTIVIGLPINMNGTEGPRVLKTREFIHHFKKFLTKIKQNSDDFEWIFWDERLSTSGAERHLIAANVSRAKRKKVIDKMAAVFILQGYLES